MHYFSLYIEFIKIRIMGIAEYRKAFILGGIAQFATYGAEFLLIWVILSKFQMINGWSSYEIMFLFALNLASYAITAFFLHNPCSQLSTAIKNGTFDEVLTKPLNSFLYLICREFNSAYYSHLLLSIIIICLCFVKLNIEVSLGNTLSLIIVLLSGALIQAAGFLFTSVPAFWIIETNSIREIIYFQTRNFIRYPISIYNKLVQILLTFLLPYAFINFYPAQFFLKKDDFLMFHPYFQYLSPFVGIILFLLAYRFWVFGTDHYKSTGS